MLIQLEFEFLSCLYDGSLTDEHFVECVDYPRVKDEEYPTYRLMKMRAKFSQRKRIRCKQSGRNLPN